MESQRVLAIAGMLFFASSLSLAQVPRTLSFQGKLTNANGASQPDGPQTVTFRLYDGPQGVLNATNESHIFSADLITLDHTPVVANSETVMKADGSITYNRGTAYTIDDATGVIRIKDFTVLSNGTSVKVSYQYTANKLWEETKTVTVKDGIISTALGDKTPLAAFLVFGQPLYLGVQVGSDPEMSPRTALSSAPSLALPYADSAAASGGTVFSITNTGPSGIAIYGRSGDSSGSVIGPPPAVSGDTHDNIGVGGISVTHVGVAGFSTSSEGVHGQSASGDGVRGQSTSGDGVSGVSLSSGAGTHGAGVRGNCTPTSGVGVYAGDRSAFGQAGFQTDFSGAATHIWCAEKGTRVFAVAAGGAVIMTSCNLCSDVRYKKDIETLQDPLASVLSLRGVSFEWDPTSAGRSFPRGRQIGFIAQEVENVLPELVSTDQDGYKSVAYQNLVPVLVEAVKEQQRQIAAQQAEIAVLRTRAAQMDDLEGRLKRLEESSASGRR